MGDRGNIAIKQPDGQYLWIYSHGRGTELPAYVQNGIRLGHKRADDVPYFNRCILTETIGHAEEGDPTGWGVGFEAGDNEHEIILIEPADRRVSIVSKTGYFNDDWKIEKARVLMSFTFDQYYALPPDSLPET